VAVVRPPDQRLVREGMQHPTGVVAPSFRGVRLEVGRVPEVNAVPVKHLALRLNHVPDDVASGQPSHGEGAFQAFGCTVSTTAVSGRSAAWYCFAVLVMTRTVGAAAGWGLMKPDSSPARRDLVERAHLKDPRTPRTSCTGTPRAGT